MRFARALLGSLGAGTCLVLAGTLAMATLSTVVAFSGLPGMRADGANSTSTAVLAAAAPVATAGQDAAPAPVALTMPPVPSRPTPSRRRTPDRRASTAIVAAPSSPARTDPSTAPPTAPATTGTGASAPPAGPDAPVVGATDSPAPARAALSPPVRRVGTALGETVATAGRGLAETLVPVSPPVATVVDETGRVAGDTVTAATEVVAGLLDGLLGH